MTKKHIKQTTFPFGKLFLVALFALALCVGYIYSNKRATSTSIDKKSKQEIELVKIKESNNIDEQRRLYTKLLDRVGPEKAQEGFQHSGVQFTGQMHLLNHTAGDYIWEKYGVSGITKCKDYFSYSCYHGFILNALGGGNLKNIDLIMAECKKQGVDSYAQCSHAVGHGYLAYVGYANLLKGLDLCDQTQMRVSDFQVSYCHNGVFMENIWGLHEGRPSPERWVSATDMRYPCNDPRIAETYLPECWYNQSIHMMNAFFNGDLVKVAQVCNDVQGEKSKYMCFDGTFRSLNTATENNIEAKFEKCKQMPEGWKETCIAVVISASFQQGDRVLPFRICADTEFGKKECYIKLIDSISYSIKSDQERDMLCQRIPLEYRETRCKFTAY